MNSVSIETTVIIPVYNEEKYIERCLRSLIEQTYPKEKMELLIIDGNSNDNTIEFLKKYMDLLNIRIINNPLKQVTYALNIGINEAKGEYIIRMDAHAEYDSKYIETCLLKLEETNADNVGGIAKTVGNGLIGEANADILSSKFGVGNSNFRTDAESGYVDTVPFGAFHRSIFKKVGLFNPDLPRSEDNDLNSRIRNNGGKVYLSTDIKFTYYCRDSITGLMTQAIKNGNALFLTLRYNPKAMSIRHFVPFMFMLSLIILIPLSFINILFKIILLIEIVSYLILDIYFSIFNGEKKLFFLKIFLYPMFHLTYGLGSFIGLIGIKLY